MSQSKKGNKMVVIVSTTIEVDSLFDGVDFQATLTREIVLVGGSTTFSRIFDGKKLNKSINPNEAMAYGAAVQTALLTNQANSDKTRDLLLLDMIPLSLGVETQGVKDPCVVIIFLDHLNSLMPHDEAKLECTFDINADGILKVTTKDKATGHKANITISNSAGRLSTTGIKHMIAESKKLKEEDKQSQVRVEAKQELDNYVYQIENTLNKPTMCEIYKFSDRSNDHPKKSRCVFFRLHPQLNLYHEPIQTQREEFIHSLSKSSPPFTILKPHLNYKHFVSSKVEISQNIINRNLKDVNINLVVDLYEKSCRLTTDLNSLKSKRNEVSKLAKSSTQQERENILQQGRMIKSQILEKEALLSTLEEELMREALKIPNDTHSDVPIGGEENARIIKIFDEPSLPPSSSSIINNNDVDIDVDKNGGGNEQLKKKKDHIELGNELDIIDFETGSNVTGNHWYYLKNSGVLLEFALIQFALQKAIEKGYMPIITPDVVRKDFSYACGFQPRENESSQNYFLSTGEENISTSNNNNNSGGSSSKHHNQLMLAATAEIPLAGIYSDKILFSKQLPKKFVGFCHSFRSESGSRGKETKGLYRVHQFSKLELFIFSKPEESEEMFQEIVDLQSSIYKDLGLPFRILDMPTFELGASAYRKYDIETWMPGRCKWGEVSSASNCTDYQSRRLNIRMKRSMLASTEFVHTLNGTAIAIPRMIISIIENFQTNDGKVVIPKVLRKWMYDMEVIDKKS
ncbi:3432_t:CDS:2 [Entrophospora sp. SA101]|nr:3432_t:CDS:2 [Entrophospora sp. SA101]